MKKRKMDEMWLCWRRIEYNRTFSLKAQHYDFFVRLLADRPPTSISTRRTCGHHGAQHGSRFLIVAINTRCLDESMLAGTRGCQAVVIRRLRDGWPITGRPDDHRHTTYNSLDTWERCEMFWERLLSVTSAPRRLVGRRDGRRGVP